MSTTVGVICDDGRRVDVAVPVGVNAPYYLRRELAVGLGVDPKLVRLGQVTVPQQVICTIIDVNAPTTTVHVCEFQGRPFPIVVPSDASLIDVKFALSTISGLVAEAHVLAPIGGGSLPDSTAAGAHRLLRVWYELPSPVPGRGPAHRTMPELLRFSDSTTTTLQSLLEKTFQTFWTFRLLGTRQWNQKHTRRCDRYDWMSYETVYNRCRNFAAGLNEIGIKPGDRIGIVSINRSEWAITDWMCTLFGYCSVTIYDTLGHDVVKFIINHADVKAVVVSQAMIKAVVNVRGQCPGLLAIVMMDDLPIEKNTLVHGYDHRMSQLEDRGAKQSLTAPTATPSDVVSICYTSGTSGCPKGVLLTQENLTSATVALNYWLAETQARPGIDTTISYLPLAHIYERLAHLSALTRGVAIGYFSGDTAQLLSDAAILRPTVFCGVPRVWQRIYDTIREKISQSGLMSKKLFHSAFSRKVAALEAADPQPDSGLLDHLVFKKIADRLGGRLIIMVSGSAPISSRVATFMRVVMRAQFVQGYGLTETCAMTTMTPPSDSRFGNVGVPMPCCELMLVSVESMGYLTSDRPLPRGEVWVRGPNVSPGYHHQADETLAAMTEEGWFRTGDIGRWRQDGRLEIIDRLKNIFKLAQGEYIRPEYIESIYKMSRFVANVFVYGDSFQDYLVAIVVPDRAQIARWIGENSMSNDPTTAMKVIQRDMDKFAEREGMKSFEKVKKIALVEEEFSIENGLLTPSLKLKRHEAEARYIDVIQRLYRQGDDSSIASKL